MVLRKVSHKDLYHSYQPYTLSCFCLIALLSVLVRCSVRMGWCLEVFPLRPGGLSHRRLGLFTCSAFDCRVVASADITCMGVPASGIYVQLPLFHFLHSSSDGFTLG